MPPKKRTIELHDGKIRLTNQEFLFADAILKGLTNLEAAKAAGYSDKSEKSLVVQAHHLLARNNIIEYIRLETQLKELERRKKIEVDDLWITEQFKEVYNRCMQRIPVMRFDRDAGQMVQEVDENGEGVWTFDSTGANRALENIAKHIGYYELDNKQRAPVIKVGVVQNVQNFFFNENEDHKEITSSDEIES